MVRADQRFKKEFLLIMLPSWHLIRTQSQAAASILTTWPALLTKLSSVTKAAFTEKQEGRLIALSDRIRRFFTSFTSHPGFTFPLRFLRQRSTSQPYAQRDAPPVGPACFRRGWF